jgi:2-keto-4-pentenoate hydratase
MLADGLVNQGLFIGPQVDNLAAYHAHEFDLTLTHSGKTQQLTAKHPNGNPRAPLYWLVEFLRSQGQGVVAGQAIITGSFAGVLDVPLGQTIRLEYAGLGTLDVNFTAKTRC